MEGDSDAPGVHANGELDTKNACKIYDRSIRERPVRPAARTGVNAPERTPGARHFQAWPRCTAYQAPRAPAPRGRRAL